MPADPPRLHLSWWLVRTLPVHVVLGAVVAWATPRWPGPVVWALLLWHLLFGVGLAAGWRWWRPYAVDVGLLLVANHLATFLALGAVAELLR